MNRRSKRGKVGSEGRIKRTVVSEQPHSQKNHGRGVYHRRDVCQFLIGMREKTNSPSLVKQILLPSLAGSTAVIFTHPLDVTKIRLQLGENIASINL
jgi:hypothetical protein